MMAKDKDAEQLLRVIEKLNPGIRIDYTTKGHPRVWPNDTTFAPVVHSGTPGDWRAIKNFKARLKRAGIDIGE